MASKVISHGGVVKVWSKAQADIPWGCGKEKVLRIFHGSVVMCVVIMLCLPMAVGVVIGGYLMGV